MASYPFSFLFMLVSFNVKVFPVKLFYFPFKASLFRRVNSDSTRVFRFRIRINLSLPAKIIIVQIVKMSDCSAMFVNVVYVKNDLNGL